MCFDDSPAMYLLAGLLIFALVLAAIIWSSPECFAVALLAAVILAVDGYTHPEARDEYGADGP